ncbi:phage tail protein [Rhizocola hellebori]|uniref:Phage tail protein n=1 Tax=Rhizocola hellebori TaxID=1392758 RepID=A0A8J3Q243_9ACTN|nr:phage tail protein [Rhizocola hellebori]GIH02234.1 phage tail protein [Rhizocola hellebori]
MTQAASQPGGWVDPYRDFNFKLLINNITNGHFTRVSGLGVKVDAIEYREAGDNATVKAIPGRTTYLPATLWYGATASTEAWDWLHSTITGKVSRRNVSIALLDVAGSAEVMRWNLTNAWPCEWRSESLDAMSREILLHSLVIAYEGLDLEPGSGGGS